MRRMLPQFGLLLAGLCLAATASAQAHAEPQHVIDYRLNLEEQDQSIGGSVVDGGRATLQIGNQAPYQISATVVNAGAGIFSVSVYQLTSIDSDDARLLETVRAVRGRPAPLRSIRQASIVIDALRPVATNADAARFSFAANLPGSRPFAPTTTSDECCLTCNNITVCGCGVDWPNCGSCCVIPCCKAPPLEPIANRMQAPRETFMMMAGLSCRPSVPAAERLFTADRPVQLTSR